MAGGATGGGTALAVAGSRAQADTASAALPPTMVCLATAGSPGGGAIGGGAGLAVGSGEESGTSRTLATPWSRPQPSVSGA